MPGVCPTMLLPPALAFPNVGVEPAVLPSWLEGVPVMLGEGVVGVGVAPNGVVVIVPGVVVTVPGAVVAAVPGAVAAAPGAATPAPGAAAPAPAAPPTWASAGTAARVAASKSGKRIASMEIPFVARLSRGNHASFVPAGKRQALENPR